MSTTAGGFGQGKQLQCTAKSKRSGVQCRGPAVAGSATQKCRMHGGMASTGTRVASFVHGRHSRYLPANLDRLYQEARSNPEILEMTDHMAMMEARINHIMGQLQEDETVPQWSDIKGLFDHLAGALASGDAKNIDACMQAVAEAIEAGVKWDTSWNQVLSTTEQLRKLADTEIKRKKELNLMVPVDRVMTLMAAVAAAVKRNVTNPIEIQKVYAEMALLQGSNRTPAGRGMLREGADELEIIDADTVPADDVDTVVGTTFDFGSDTEVEYDV